VYILVSIFRQRFCCRQQTQLSTRPSHTYNSIIHVTLVFWRTFLQPRLTREATTYCLCFCPCKANDWLHQSRPPALESVCLSYHFCRMYGALLV
jgi:hypothetical protein